MHQNKGMSVHLLAEHMLQEKELMKDKKKAAPNKKKKKSYVKYKGD